MNSYCMSKSCLVFIFYRCLLVCVCVCVCVCSISFHICQSGCISPQLQTIQDLHLQTCSRSSHPHPTPPFTHRIPSCSSSIYLCKHTPNLALSKLGVWKFSTRRGDFSGSESSVPGNFIVVLGCEFADLSNPDISANSVFRYLSNLR